MPLNGKKRTRHPEPSAGRTTPLRSQDSSHIISAADKSPQKSRNRSSINLTTPRCLLYNAAPRLHPSITGTPDL